ncbi:hypothetical protein [Caloranaerobacter sp. TR13]|uniref:hypothetical protein n=1 Tax=Caloranaerobacter sp. TR13 TaxID=1302151 RepID=UPI00137935E7|nr:hypothetical protein [Caloranaerobacter sp. TR13]
MIKIIDTFKEFKEVFQNNLDLSIEEKIGLWDKAYIQISEKEVLDYLHDNN